MKGIKCAFMAIARDAEIKRTKANKDYLSLTVTRDDDDERIWVAAWRDVDELVDKIKPGLELYIEGTIKLRRWDGTNGPQSALSVSADRVEVLFDINGKPKPRTKAAKQEAKNASLFTGPAPQRKGLVHDGPNDEIPF